MASALTIQVVCPLCQTSFVTQVQNILDVGQEPELKTALLQGRINVAICPNCKRGGVLGTPLLYHDPDKELLLVFVPEQMNLKAEEREKLIGSLANSLISRIPAEKRRGYLLQPKTLLSLERLMEEILMADGITKEMLEAERRALALVQQLLAAKDNPDGLKALVEEHRQELDYPFFLLLSTLIEAAHEDGDQQRAEQLEGLRAKLLELTTLSVPKPLPEGATREDLIEELLKAESEDALQGLVITNRRIIDYMFYQSLTGRLEASESTGDTEMAEKLRNLRSKVLEITDELDKQMQAAQQEIIALIEELLKSEELDKEIPQHLADYDALFFIILRSVIEQAARAGDTQLMGKLEDLQRRVIALLEEQMPPELRLINRLLQAEYPEGTRDLLQAHAGEITERLVATMRRLAADLGSQQGSKTAQKLQDIAEQAASFLREKPAPSA